jgi:NTP pyrophosphatase (non-canonical NTP hydrolase)
MQWWDYQDKAVSLRVAPEEVVDYYLPLKLAGEAGEVAEKYGKAFRKYGADFKEKMPDSEWLEFRGDLAKELGDVLWYLANIAERLGCGLDDIAYMNIEKLLDRKARGVIEGNGDNR